MEQKIESEDEDEDDLFGEKKKLSESEDDEEEEEKKEQPKTVRVINYCWVNSNHTGTLLQKNCEIEDSWGIWDGIHQEIE